MGRELGRISGPLLANNLLRNGNNLAFDTQVLYLDVVNGRVGFNTTTPVNDLYAPNAIDAVGLTVDNTADLGNFVISTNNIQNAIGNITLSGIIVTPGLTTNNLHLSSNIIGNNVTNDNINISPNGSGAINLSNQNSNVQVTVNGNLHATGNITFDGNITLGSSPSSTINFTAEVNSNILPNANNAYSLGSNSLQWANVYTNTFSVGSTTVPTTSSTTMNVGNLSFNGTTITNTSVSTNTQIVPTGSGIISLNGTTFTAVNQNSITNSTTGAYTLSSTGQGYYQFTGTDGIGIPSGTTAQRPFNAVIGMIRFNTTLGYGEFFNGGSWNAIGGASATLSLDQVTNIMITDAIIFGR
jgi:hypothetical protein